jgi:hypothetical protein
MEETTWEDLGYNITFDVRNVGCEYGEKIYMAEDRDHCWAVVNWY